MLTPNKLFEEFLRTTETRKVWGLHSKSTIHFCDGVERNKSSFNFYVEALND